METEYGLARNGATPTVLLGQLCQLYTKGDVWKILGYYGVEPKGEIGRYPKTHLLHLLDELIRDRGLTTSDRYKILPTRCYKSLLALGLIQGSQVTPSLRMPKLIVEYQGTPMRSGQYKAAHYKTNRAEAIRWLGINRVNVIEPLIHKRVNRAQLRAARTLPELDAILASLGVVKQRYLRLPIQRDITEDSTATTAPGASPPSSPLRSTELILSVDRRDAIRLQNTALIENFLQSQLEVGQILVTNVHKVSQGLGHSIERHVYRKANSEDEYQSLLKSSLRQLMRPGTAMALINKAEERIAAARQPSTTATRNAPSNPFSRPRKGLQQLVSLPLQLPVTHHPILFQGRELLVPTMRVLQMTPLHV
ncbi:hypothetical protein MMC30_007418 [Trapelia coarctata]|nr:hypothetical protein [Trapelia coarctata]